MATTYTTETKSVRSAIRSPYAWPGGYPIYVVLADGAMLCSACARENYRQIAWETRLGVDGGWKALGSTILYETEDQPEQCAHCYCELESAYGVVTPA